jgi:hypothetical protein
MTRADFLDERLYSVSAAGLIEPLRQSDGHAIALAGSCSASAA